MLVYFYGCRVYGQPCCHDIYATRNFISKKNSDGTQLVNSSLIHSIVYGKS